MSSGHAHSAASQNKKKMKVVVGLTLTYFFAEVIGGIMTGSLALLADAGHMLTDVAGLCLALFAIFLSEKPATPKQTYGYYRAEIMAALANAVVLIVISLYIIYEAYERFVNPPEIMTGPMLVVASVGLGVNIVGLFLLRDGSKQSINVKGAYFEVLSDMLTSVGVILAAGIMWATGWYYADPIVSAGIGLFILPRTWILMREAVHILLEGTPSNINLASVRESIISLSQVEGVHDLHVWSLTSGKIALSAHVVRRDQKAMNDLIMKIQKVMHDRYGISHCTIQLEDRGLEEAESHL